MIVNHNTTQVANITITGNESIIAPTTKKNINKLDYSKEIAYNGWFGETDKNKHNGRLNLIYKPTTEDRTLLLSGGTNLKGDITQAGGTLVFSGRPTPHAYNHLKKTYLNWKVYHKAKLCGITIGSTAHLKQKTSKLKAEVRWFLAMFLQLREIGPSAIMQMPHLVLCQISKIPFARVQIGQD